MAMRLKVAAQTTLEPEIAEKPPHPKTLVVIAKTDYFFNTHQIYRNFAFFLKFFFSFSCGSFIFFNFALFYFRDVFGFHRNFGLNPAFYDTHCRNLWLEFDLVWSISSKVIGNRFDYATCRIECICDSHCFSQNPIG